MLRFLALFLVTPAFGGTVTFAYVSSLFESVTPFQGVQAFPGASVIIYDPAAAPEPATFVIVGLALLWLAAWGRRLPRQR